MIVVLGASGYIGRAFAWQLSATNQQFLGISRQQIDYYDVGVLSEFLRESRASFLINCGGYTGKPNVDACELAKADCVYGNVVLPGRLRGVCERLGLPWGQISSGCIYTGQPASGYGFNESDEPNFCFRTNNCSFYSGTKALGEEVLLGSEKCFVWRLRIPFNHVDSPRNYLSKLLNYARLLDVTNSLSHLDEFVTACLSSWRQRIPFGTYNVVNTGAVSTSQVVQLLRKHLAPDRAFEFFENEQQFMQLAASTPRSNCVLDNRKLTSTGIPMSDVVESLERALRNWQKS